MAAGERLYVVVDPDGNVHSVQKDVKHAVAAAGQIAPEVTVDIAPASSALGDLGDLDAIPASSMPEVALKSCGVKPIDFARAMKLSLEDAYTEVFPFFSDLRKKGKPVKLYQSAAGLSKGLLGQNYKTEKETPEEPSDVQGLSLLPESRALEFVKSLCVGSSRACRAACLVYSGRNEADLYNGLVKFARTRAFLERPEAFVRMLVDSIEKRRHHRYTDGKQYELFVRLNVFSDVPWELVAPALFEYFGEVQFYDYTKVPGRRPASNYDLTFSYSGANQEYVSFELGRRSRVAIVFLAPPGTPRVFAKDRLPGYGLPTSIRGMRVVDGDVSDVRPRDPAPSVVALRWKPPKKAGESGTEKKSREKTARRGFVVETQRDEAFVIQAQELDGWLITSQSARQEPIVDPDGYEELEAAE